MNPERVDDAVALPPFRVPAFWYGAAEPRATLLLVPALGTAAGYYRPVATALSARGIQVLVPEVPGTGESSPRPSRAADYGYRDLVERYLPALAALARDRGGERPLVLAGHSLGAQVVALAVLHGHVAPAAVLSLAGGLIYYRYWDGAAAYGLLAMAAAVTAVTYACGYLPGRLVGFGGPQARTLMREWSQAIRQGRYPGFAERDRVAVTVPAMSVYYEGDGYAPRRSAAALASALGGERRGLDSDRPGNPHAGWARQPETTVACVEEWLAGNGILQPAGA